MESRFFMNMEALSAFLGVPVNELRKLERQGVIRKTLVPDREDVVIIDQLDANGDPLITPEQWAALSSDLANNVSEMEEDMGLSLLQVIKETRNEKGLSQRALADLSGISQPAIANLETGTSGAQLSTVLALLDALGKKVVVVDNET